VEGEAAEDLDGVPDDARARRVQISIPEQYKVTSDEVWEDLESYLFTGFLTSHAKLVGRSFVFKTLNHVEIQGMSYLRPAGGSPADVQETYKAAFIAHSVFYIDGENVLHERPRFINRLVKTVKKIPAKVQDEILEQLGALNGKASRLHPLTEVYVHENRSRFKWLQLKGTSVNFASSTGISGTDLLGMNYCQQAWTALNRLLDQREEMESEWSNAKFVGSCFNGKGVRSVDERDRARKERERSEREDKKMRVLYRFLNRLPAGDDRVPSEVTLPDGRRASVVKSFRAESVDDLAEQLSAALSGEKDHHDRIVEARERQNMERRQDIDGLRRLVYSSPGVDPGGSVAGRYASSSVPASGSSRILGGKAEADAYIERMNAIRLDAAARLRNMDLSSSDEPDSEKPRKA
jgi:hypothetical protein